MMRLAPGGIGKPAYTRRHGGRLPGAYLKPDWRNWKRVCFVIRRLSVQVRYSALRIKMEWLHDGLISRAHGFESNIRHAFAARSAVQPSCKRQDVSSNLAESSIAERAWCSAGLIRLPSRVRFPVLQYRGAARFVSERCIQTAEDAGSSPVTPSLFRYLTGAVRWKHA